MPAAHRVRLGTLVREELRALPRNRFALGGVTLGLLLIPLIALVDSDGWGFHALFWLVSPLAVGVVVAARVASARRTRFVDSLYTTPLAPATWFLAHAIVGVVILVATLAVLLPFVFVHAIHLGVPGEALQLLAAGFLIGLFAVAWGLLAGVAVGEAGPGAAAAVAAIVGFLSFISLFIQALFLSAPVLSPGKTILLRIVHVTPLVLATDVTGVALLDQIAVAPLLSAVALAVLVGGAVLSAFWIATRLQSPLGWERRPGRAGLVALLVLTLLLPAAIAAPQYTPEPEGPDTFSMEDEHAVTIVPRGTAITDETVTLAYYWDLESLTMGEKVERDLLVLLRVPADARIRELRIVPAGDETLVVAGGLYEATATSDGRARETRGFSEPDGTGPLRPVFRVPVTLHPVSTDSLQNHAAAVRVRVTFLSDGGAVESEAILPVFVGVANASTQLVAASAPLPILAVGALVRRTLRTR